MDGQNVWNGTDDEDDVLEIEFLDVDAGEGDSGVEGNAEDSVEETAVESTPPIDDRLSAFEEEINHLREMYLRKLAEFDNFRKRVEKEKQELRKTAGEDIILDLLPVLDNFERALEHSSETAPEAFQEGVEMIFKQLLAVLEKRGLEHFSPTGEPFQPEYHEAIQRVEDPACAPGTVAWVLTPGYRFGGRLIRPAMVGVCVEASPADTEEELHAEEDGAM